MRYSHRLEHIQIPVNEGMKKFITKRLEICGYDVSSAFREIYEYGTLVSRKDEAKIELLQTIIDLIVPRYFNLTVGLAKANKAMSKLASKDIYSFGAMNRRDRLQEALNRVAETIDKLRDIQDYYMKGMEPQSVFDALDIFPGDDERIFDVFVENHTNRALKFAEMENLAILSPMVEICKAEYEGEKNLCKTEGKKFGSDWVRKKFTIPVTCRMKNVIGLGPKSKGPLEYFWSIPSSDIEIPQEIMAAAEKYKQKIKELKDANLRLKRKLHEECEDLYNELERIIRQFYDTNLEFSEERDRKNAILRLKYLAKTKGMTLTQAIDWAYNQMQES